MDRANTETQTMSLQRKSWYVATMDDGIIHGPIATYSTAKMYAPDCETMGSPRRITTGFYETARCVIGTGEQMVLNGYDWSA